MPTFLSVTCLSRRVRNIAVCSHHNQQLRSDYSVRILLHCPHSQHKETLGSQVAAKLTNALLMTKRLCFFSSFFSFLPDVISTGAKSWQLLTHFSKKSCFKGNQQQCWFTMQRKCELTDCVIVPVTEKKEKIMHIGL